MRASWSSEPVLLSAIVPTFKRPERLRALLEGIVPQVGRVSYEVIVVDDGGGQIDDVIQDFREVLPLRLLTQENSGPGEARNYGAREARGQRLVFIDDDCVPNPDWLKQISLAHQANPRAALGGLTVNLLERNHFSAASQLLIDFLYWYFFHDLGGDDAFLTTNNASVPRDKFLESGGFDAGFERAAGEDREFFDRWRFLGGELVFRPSIVVGHAHNLDLRTFMIQHFRYGEAARRFWLLKWAREGKQRRLKTKFFRKLVLYPFKTLGLNLRAFTASCLIGLSQITNAAGYFWASLKEYGGSSPPVSLESSI